MEINMKTCPNCSTTVAQTAKYCASCGVAQVPAAPKHSPLMADSDLAAEHGPISDRPVTEPPTWSPSTSSPDATARPDAGDGRRGGQRLSTLSDQLEVDADHVSRAGRVAAFGTVPLLLLCLLTVVVLALAAAPDGHHGSVLDWLRAAIWLGGMAWHGTLSISGRGSLGADLPLSGSVQGVSTGTFAPLLLTMFTIGWLVWSARRDERQRPSSGFPQLLARSVLTGGLLAIAWLLLSAVSRASSGF